MKTGLIKLQHISDSRGSLVIAEGNSSVIPFDIKRIFYIYGSDSDIVRGKHANRKSSFILINISGSSKVRTDDGNGCEQIFDLDKPDVGLYIPPMVWKDMYNFSPNSIMLVLSSEHFDEDEYIRNYEAFIEEIKKENSDV